MKKLIIFGFLTSFLIASLIFVSVFNKKIGVPKDKSSIKIITTLFPIYYFTKNLVQDKIEVVLVLPSGADPHYFEITPDILKEIKEADYIFLTNTYLDFWALKIKNNFPNLKIVPVTQKVNFLKIGENYDPHFWHSLEEDKKVVNEIYQNVVKIDPLNKEFYEKNYRELINKIEELQKRSLQELASLKNDKLITKHNAFSYLARDYNLKIIGYLEKEEGELTPQEIKNLIEAIKKYNLKVIFGETSTNNEKVYNFAKNLGLEVYLLNSLEKPDKDFFQAYEENIKIIKEALNK